MPPKSIELILFKQLASYLAISIFMVDTDGNLIYCNEAAEKILGFRFSETGEMTAKEWSTVFMPQDRDGNPIKLEKLPLFISYTQHRVALGNFYIRNLQNKLKHISVLTLPIINQMDHLHGAIAFFQEIE